MAERKEELTVKQKIAMFSANKAAKPIAPGQTKETKNGQLPELAKHSYTPPIPSPQPAQRENAKYIPPVPKQKFPLTEPAQPPVPPAAAAVAAPGPTESESKCAAIGDGVSLWTENVKGPSTIYKYTVESTILKKVLFTFNFEGSENFQLSPASVLESPLEARVIINPFERSETIICQQVDPTKGGNLKMSMSWTLSNPDPESVIKYVSKYEADLADQLQKAAAVYGDGKHIKTATEALSVCASTDIPFFDMTFPPVFDSMSKVDGSEVDSSTRRTIVWRRPTCYLTPGTLPEIHGRSIEPKHVKQGYLSDFYFTTALAIIAEQPSLITKLFEGLNTPEANAKGIYQVQFCICGIWVTTMVDDFFPCLPQATPVYSRNVGNKLWVLLLEKAYAKLHGSYKSIKVGWSIDALANLTGAPQKEYRMSELALMSEEERVALWEYFQRCMEQRYVLSCSACNTAKGTKDKELAKLRLGHSYYLMDAVTTSAGQRLAKFRNPWSSLEWNGSWGNKSSMWTAEIKAEVGFKESEDDTFWICFEDFTDHFVSMNICFVRDPSTNESQWYEFRQPVDFKFRKHERGLEEVPMYNLVVGSFDPEVEVFASIHQGDKRGVNSPRYLDIGLCILRLTEDGEYEYVISTGNSITRQNQLSVAALPAGSYVIIPSTACCKMEQRKKKLAEDGKEPTAEDLTVHTALVVHSSAPVSVTPMPYDASLAQLSAELAISKDGTVTDLFGDSSVTLFTRKSPGNMGICYAAKNNRESGAVCFTLDVSDSDNIISDKGILMAECPIPAGRTKLILHVAPADDEYSWTCGLFCKARTVNVQEMEMLLEAEATM